MSFIGLVYACWLGYIIVILVELIASCGLLYLFCCFVGYFIDLIVCDGLRFALWVECGYLCYIFNL